MAMTTATASTHTSAIYVKTEQDLDVAVTAVMSLGSTGTAGQSNQSMTSVPIMDTGVSACAVQTPARPTLTPLPNNRTAPAAGSSPRLTVGCMAAGAPISRSLLSLAAGTAVHRPGHDRTDSVPVRRSTCTTPDRRLLVTGGGSGAPATTVTDQQSHAVAPLYKCNVCALTVLSDYELEQHMRRMHGVSMGASSRSRCSSCRALFYDLLPNQNFCTECCYLVNDGQSNPPGGRDASASGGIYICSTCGVTRESLGTCQAHMVSHYPGMPSAIAHGAPSLCMSCHLVFLTAEDREEHECLVKTRGYSVKEVASHLAAQTYFCSSCGEACPSFDACTTHMSSHYPPMIAQSLYRLERELVFCEDCRVVFVSPDSKSNHVCPKRHVKAQNVPVDIVQSSAQSAGTQSDTTVTDIGPVHVTPASPVRISPPTGGVVHSLAAAAATAVIPKSQYAQQAYVPPGHRGPVRMTNAAPLQHVHPAPYQGTPTTPLPAPPAPYQAIPTLGGTAPPAPYPPTPTVALTAQSEPNVPMKCNFCPRVFMSFELCRQHAVTEHFPSEEAAQRYATLHIAERQNTAPYPVSEAQHAVSSTAYPHLPAMRSPVLMEQTASFPCSVSAPPTSPSLPSLPLASLSETAGQTTVAPSQCSSACAASADNRQAQCKPFPPKLKTLRFDCKPCGATFTSRSALENHQAVCKAILVPEKHTDAQTNLVSCPGCSKEFGSPANLEAHECTVNAAEGVVSERLESPHVSGVPMPMVTDVGDIISVSQSLPMCLPDELCCPGDAMLTTPAAAPERGNSPATVYATPVVMSTGPGGREQGVVTATATAGNSLPVVATGVVVAMETDGMMTSSGSEISNAANGQRFSCGVCQTDFPSELLLDAHCRKEHATDSRTDVNGQSDGAVAGDGDYPCALCTERFTGLKLLQSHHELHADVCLSADSGVYTCPRCAKQFGWRSNLVRHFSYHADIRPHTCGVCQKRFRAYRGLKSHLITHSIGKPHVCDVCGNKYISAASLAHHKGSHTEAGIVKRHACQYCGKRFRAPSDLERHVKSHLRKMQHTCQQCNASFREIDDLISHVRESHNLTYPSGVTVSSMVLAASGTDATPKVDYLAGTQQSQLPRVDGSAQSPVVVETNTMPDDDTSLGRHLADSGCYVNDSNDQEDSDVSDDVIVLVHTDDARTNVWGPEDGQRILQSRGISDSTDSDASPMKDLLTNVSATPVEGDEDIVSKMVVLAPEQDEARDAYTRNPGKVAGARKRKSAVCRRILSSGNNEEYAIAPKKQCTTPRKPVSSNAPSLSAPSAPPEMPAGTVTVRSTSGDQGQQSTPPASHTQVVTATPGRTLSISSPINIFLQSPDRTGAAVAASSVQASCNSTEVVLPAGSLKVPTEGMSSGSQDSSVNIHLDSSSSNVLMSTCPCSCGGVGCAIGRGRSTIEQSQQQSNENKIVVLLPEHVGKEPVEIHLVNRIILSIKQE